MIKYFLKKTLFFLIQRIGRRPDRAGLSGGRRSQSVRQAVGRTEARHWQTGGWSEARLAGSGDRQRNGLPKGTKKTIPNYLYIPNVIDNCFS